MEKAVVMRVFPDGRCARLAVVDRAVAQAFVLQDWIALRKAGRVASYEISAPGKAALKRLVEVEDQARMVGGLAEAPMAFADQHRIWGERVVVGEEGPRRSPCWVGGAKRMGGHFWNRCWSRLPSGCAKISKWRRWAQGWRRIGSGF
jgi:hypothetical protein